jgi:Flp pilus assembly protein TadG
MRQPVRRTPLRKGRQKGHAMIELALCAGVMIACLSGTFQFGYTFYVYDELVSAVGNGARYAASRTYRAASPADIEKGNAAIRNLVVYGNPVYGNVVYGNSRPAPNAAPVAPNLKPENVQVNWIRSDSGAPSAVDVTIVNYSVGAMFGTLPLNHRPLAEFPFVGRYAPTESEP